MTILVNSTDDTNIEAELERTSQRAELLLKRTFSAPRSLAYTALTFEGNTFVKNNIIARLLQSDIDRVQKQGGSTVAIVESNYRFFFRDIEDVEGRRVYAFVLKPRRKESGLFRGKIFIDAQTGHVVRATGKLSKSPSWWIKRVDFTQDYIDIGEFTMPRETRLHTQVRVIGPVAIVIRHTSYQLHSIDETDCGNRVSPKVAEDVKFYPTHRLLHGQEIAGTDPYLEENWEFPAGSQIRLASRNSPRVN